MLFWCRHLLLLCGRLRSQLYVSSIYYRSELNALNLCVFYGRTFSKHSFVTHSLIAMKGRRGSSMAFVVFMVLLHILNCANHSNKTSEAKMNAMKRRWLKVDAENTRLHRRDKMMNKTGKFYSLYI